MDVIALLSLLFVLMLGLFAVLGGLYQLYHALVGTEDHLDVGGRFKFLFGFNDPTLTGKRVFWSIGGIVLVLGGFAFLGLAALWVRSGL